MKKLEIKVKTNASVNEVKIIEHKKLLVNITKSPEKGKANKKVISLLAKFFKVHQKQIEIIKGLKKNIKLLELINTLLFKISICKK